MRRLYGDTFKKGWSVAHEAAWTSGLSKGYDLWEIADNNGWTVAREAAWAGRLPQGFALWDLTDNRGVTVRDVAEDPENY
jgi:hypothetical protein